MMRALARRLQQDPQQVDFGYRRFRLRLPGDRIDARTHLETIARAFLSGYNNYIRAGQRGWQRALTDHALEVHGFIYEGAGMAATLLDILTLSRGRRVVTLINESDRDYSRLIHVGAGWAFARLRQRPWGFLAAPHPMLRWLAWDGYGFHQGFFDADRTIGTQYQFTHLAQELRAICDQGLGRMLWFHECADPVGIALRIGEFPTHRQSNLWSGIGLAAGYAGGFESGELERLTVMAGNYQSHLAQGVTYACSARCAADVIPSHTEDAARIVVGADAALAAKWADTSLRLQATTGTTAADYLRARGEVRRLWMAYHEREA